MQTIGYININGQILLVLVRQKKRSRQLKIRKSGKLGIRLIDEENYLKDYCPCSTSRDSLIDSLNNGNVIEL